MKAIHCILLSLLTLLCLQSCAPPPPSYPERASIIIKKNKLEDELICLLPAVQQSLPKAREEAKWLSDTAFRAGAAIARLNGSYFPGWLGNGLVNMGVQDRGLCWQYQHDMYREMRRRKLQYFRLGTCVRDNAKATEHSCIYIASKNGHWPAAWVLDPWMWNGRMKTDPAWELNRKRWKESPAPEALLSHVYNEEHNYPMEHWLAIKNGEGGYSIFWYINPKQSQQYHRMQENILEGKKSHPNKPYDYYQP